MAYAVIIISVAASIKTQGIILILKNPVDLLMVLFRFAVESVITNNAVTAKKNRQGIVGVPWSIVQDRESCCND